MLTEAGFAWAPVLRELSAGQPDWVVWKHAAHALAGSGDVDSALPRHRWLPARTQLIAALRRRTDVTHLVLCDHVPDAQLVLVISPSTWPQVQEIDFATALSFRGVRWAPAETLASLAVPDAAIRTLRPGAEAFVLVVLNAIDAVGRLQLGRLKERDRADVEQAVREDGGGVYDGVSLLPSALRPAGRQLARLLLGGATGGWTGLPLFAAGMALLDHRAATARVRTRIAVPCPVLAFAISGRVAPAAADADRWAMHLTTSGHEVIRL